MPLFCRIIRDQRRWRRLCQKIRIATNSKKAPSPPGRNGLNSHINVAIDKLFKRPSCASRFCYPLEAFFTERLTVDSSCHGISAWANRPSCSFLHNKNYRFLWGYYRATNLQPLASDSSRYELPRNIVFYPHKTARDEVAEGVQYRAVSGTATVCRESAVAYIWRCPQIPHRRSSICRPADRMPNDKA